MVRAETIAVQAGPRPFEDETLIGVVRQAIMAMRALRFRYRGGSRQGQERDVTPFGIMFGRSNYLVGADLGSTQPTNYRLDRIEALQILDQPSVPPLDFSLQDYATRSFGIFQGELEEVVLRVLPGAAADALGWRFIRLKSSKDRATGQ